MSDKQSDGDLSNQASPYIRTMRKDLSSSDDLAVSEPTPAAGENQPLVENSFSTIKTPSAPTPAAPTMDSSSPFSKTYFEQTSPTVPSAPASVKKTTPNGPPVAAKKGNGLFIFISLSLIAVALLAGGYLYWTTRSAETTIQETPQINPPAETPPAQEPVKINPLSEKYSSQNPNYLTIDTNTATPESIVAQLAAISSEIGQSGLTAAIEFIVTDVNNNPVAFHIFCALAKIEVPAAFLSSLDDNFSLYAYSDAGKTRLGLVADFKERSAAATQAKTAEGNMAKIFSILLPQNTALPTALSFKDSSYESYAVRYSNIDSVAGLSIDYALNEKSFTLGTSKDTLRAILDKTSQAKSVAPAQTPISPADPEKQTAPIAPTASDNVAIPPVSPAN